MRRVRVVSGTGCERPRAIIPAGQSGLQMTADHPAERSSGGMSVRTRQRMLIWLVLSVLTGLVVYVGFRAYLNPELLFHFVSGMHC